MPTTEESFANCVKEEKAVIVLNHALIADLENKPNDSRTNRAGKKVMDGFAKTLLVCGIFSLDPLAWLYAVICFVFGGVMKDAIKGYTVYSGMDVNDEKIIVLIRSEDCDPKLDVIKYDESYVKSVSPKPLKWLIKV